MFLVYNYKLYRGKQSLFIVITNILTFLLKFHIQKDETNFSLCGQTVMVCCSSYNYFIRTNQNFRIDHLNIQKIISCHEGEASCTMEGV